VVGRGTVRLSVTCSEACSLRTTGTALGLALRGTLQRLAGDQRVVVTLRASRRIRRALARRGSVAVQLRARDAAGNLRTGALTVAVKRG
jgi:hypothetical protein